MIDKVKVLNGKRFGLDIGVGEEGEAAVAEQHLERCVEFKLRQVAFGGMITWCWRLYLYKEMADSAFLALRPCLEGRLPSASVPTTAYDFHALRRPSSQIPLSLFLPHRSPLPRLFSPDRYQARSSHTRFWSQPFQDATQMGRRRMETRKAAAQ